MIRVGDRLRLRPSVEGGCFLGEQPCRVVYVHPDKRYYTVEFNFELGERSGSFREAYFMERSRAETPREPERNRSRVYRSAGS